MEDIHSFTRKLESFLMFNGSRLVTKKMTTTPPICLKRFQKVQSHVRFYFDSIFCKHHIYSNLNGT